MQGTTSKQAALQDSIPVCNPNSKLRIAYLLSRYPAISHTFFLKEVLGLRKLGFDIHTASVNLPDRNIQSLLPIELEETKTTYYLKRTRFLNALLQVALILLKHPRIVLRGFKSTWNLSTWDLHQRAYTFFYLIEALLLGHWMLKHDLRHLHVHFGGPVATVGLLTSQTWGITYSLTVHGPEEFYDVQLSYLPQKIAAAKFICCISEFCRSQVMKYCDPADWDKIQVARLGVDIQEFSPIDHQRASSSLRIVCVGRLVPAKGQHILLNAFANLVSRGYSMQLIFVGDGPDRSSLEQSVMSLGLGEHVTFRGALNHDQTRTQLMQADIFALASFAEGVPVALMEALAMGIPTVSTYIAGIPELIRDGIDGILVPPSSVEALTQAIERIVLDPKLRQELSRAARSRAIELSNLSANLESLAAIFESRLC